jgi:hypothetical protein
MGQVTTFFLGLSLFFGAYSFAQNPATAAYSEYRRMSPTLYYIPIYNLDENYTCEKRDKKNTLRDHKLQPVVVMCKRDYKNCMMQGSCAVVIKEQRQMLHYFEIRNKEPLFRLAELGECPYGRGPGNVCLEPFYTVAADPAFHKSGEVIYVPALKGLSLPNGKIHDGFMVVRDQGGRIKGPDRFDFFTGFHHHESEANPFTALKLGDKTTNLPYAKVTDEKLRRRILSRRSYPRIPAN